MKKHSNGLKGAALVFLLAVMILPACSNKKNTFVRRVYNNLTAHYNTWWNGNESLKEGIRDIEKNVKDNYTETLPVFKLGAKKDLSSINAKADRAIEKASKVIQNNSMYFNKKEYNRWIDDSYLMIGKAYFYKQEYTSARRTFEFILSRYKESPLTPEVYLWLALTNNQMGQFTRSDAELEKFRLAMNKTLLPRNLMLFYHKVAADFWLKQQNLEDAKRHLIAASGLSRDKTNKTRMLYILGQLYMNEGQLDKASEMFRGVVKRNPRYDMVFSAQLNLARCFDATTGDAERINRMLNSMLEDEKNKNFQDQIYYALAEVAIKQGKQKEGLDFLVLSVARSKGNDFQRVQSSLRAADLFFAKPQYIEAQAYYDTALQALPKEHPNYESLQQKTTVLTELVTNLVVIQTEDSLQKVAAMPEAERNRLIDGIIAKLAEEKRKKEEEERMNQMAMPGMDQISRSLQNNPSGAWYFYNPSAVSFGFTDFKRRWGNRKLEDLWRLSNKMVVDFGDDPEALLAAGDSATGDTTRRSTDPMKRDTYLQNLPNTPELIAESNQKLIDAHFNAAFVYREGLKDYGNAALTFEALAERYPDTAINSHYLIACYQLVVLNERLGYKEKADHYRRILITEYPDTDYARILADPDYNREIERKNNLVNTFYNETYKAYQTGQYYQVIMNGDDAKQKYPGHKLLPRFELLRALAVGKVDVADSLAANLQRVVRAYPSDPVGVYAREILQLLGKNDPALAEKIALDASAAAPEVIEEPSPYTSGMNTQHFLLIVASPAEVDVNALKVRISDFNQRSFSLDALNITGMMLSDTLEVVSVGVFGEGTKAMNYYTQITGNEYVFSALQGKQHAVMVISQPNYPVFYQSKDVSKYLAFFRKEYLKESK